ncbi:hypothetical protein [Methanobacterium sp. ACI-7]|uniref:hypothetical protein n=1 Tax=unclassified Methanobacterium TaxID=2627676 RepID=UPI0039C09A24
MFNINLEEGKEFFQKILENENTMARMNNIFQKTQKRINIKHKSEIIVGKSITAYDKTIYPIVEMTTFEGIPKLSNTEITPIALIVKEADDGYLISFTEKENDPQELIKRISGEENSEKVIELLRKMI